MAQSAPLSVPRKLLGDLVRNLDSQRRPVTRSDRSEGLYPYYGANGIQDYVEDYIFDGTFLLVGEDGSVMEKDRSPILNWVSGKIWVNNHAHILEMKSKDLELRFLFHFLRTVDISSYVTGGTQLKLNQGRMNQIPVPVPPLDVQHEIVRILDNFTELEASLEAELEARRAQYEHYRLALVSFPRTTRRVFLEEIVFFINAKAHERFVDPAGDVALLTARFVSTQGRSARFVNSKDVLTPALRHDVALVMSDLPNGRALARAFFVPEVGKYAANQRVCLLRVKDERVVLPRFLYYLIDRNKQLLAYDSGVDQTHLKKSYILEVQLALPELAEQIRITSILDAFDALVNDLSVGLPAELAARRKQYEYYRDRLLTFDELPA